MHSQIRRAMRCVASLPKLKARNNIYLKTTRSREEV